MLRRAPGNALGVTRGDISGATADLGIMVPLAAALILTNGLSATSVFVCAGGLAIASGLYFRMPFPVQPLKALTAVAVAEQLTPGVIHAAGLEIGAFLLVLSVGSIADRVARIFTRPIVRALQVGVGVLLVITAIRLVTEPPPVFRGTPASPWPIALGAIALAAVWWAARTGRYQLAVLLLLIGAVTAWWIARPAIGPSELSSFSFALPRAGDFATALVLLVIPQMPLTFGNAVVAVSDVARSNLGDAARRVTPSRVCISCGAANIVSALVGGMPMCHGAGGLTAHLRLGARTRWMNVGLGAAFVALGLAFGDGAPAALGLLPVWVLAAFLAYAGARHAMLVADLAGWDLRMAVLAGAVGAWRGNLAVTVAIGLAYEATRRTTNRTRTRAASRA